MREDFLHYLWKHQFFAIKKLHTVHNESLQINFPGEYNLNAGPDFFNAKIVIGKQVWVGNVEIHIKASDWYAHTHEKDENYDSVILHVVWINDMEVFRKNNSRIATLELKSFVSNDLIDNYQQLFSKKKNWIACGYFIGSADKFVLNNWLEVLYIERLEQKSELILLLLDKSANDWETVLFQLLAKNFGLKINGNAFLNLSQSIDYRVVKRTWSKQFVLEALMFGQAGLLKKDIEDAYFKKLKSEYDFLRLKFNLSPLFQGQFQFFRLRPNNFPTIRLSQLAMLYYKQQNLFSKIMEINRLDDYYDLFNLKTSEYWDYHYTFNSKSSKRPKYLTHSFINLLLINTILPLKFIYLKHIGKLDVGFIIDLIRKIPAENNSIIKNFESILNNDSHKNKQINNALMSQAFIHLKTNYCNQYNCLKCAIGNLYLKN